MKFIHTADLHLGRTLSGRSLVDDQRAALWQLLKLVESEKPDAVIIAGDIYDRALPPTDAVSLLNEFLEQLVLDRETPCLMIGGNHDSMERLEFGSRLLQRAGLHVRTKLEEVTNPIELNGVPFFAIPYHDPSTLWSAFLGSEGARSHQEAMEYVVGLVDHEFHDRQGVVVAHAFLSGGGESESERPLSIGGSGLVSASVFEGFDYVALGHLHQPQTLGEKGRCRYSGSLLKYSFSEQHQKKSFTIIDLEIGKPAKTTTVPIQAKRDVRVISGTFDELVAAAARDEAKDDFLRIKLMDDAPVLDAKNRLSQYYPNVLEVARPTISASSPNVVASADIRRLSMYDHFSNFYQQITGEKMGTERSAVLIQVLDGNERADE